MSFEDMVRLVSHYNIVYSDRKDKSDDELKARGYSPEIIKQLRSKQKSENYSPLESCGLRFMSDYRNCKYDLFMYVIQLHNLYQKGVLPFPGSASEQPGQIMDIFGLLDLLQLERQNRIAAQNQKAKK